MKTDNFKKCQSATNFDLYIRKHKKPIDYKRLILSFITLIACIGLIYIYSKNLPKLVSKEGYWIIMALFVLVMAFVISPLLIYFKGEKLNLEYVVWLIFLYLPFRFFDFLTTLLFMNVLGVEYEVNKTAIWFVNFFGIQTGLVIHIILGTLVLFMLLCFGSILLDNKIFKILGFLLYATFVYIPYHNITNTIIYLKGGGI